MKKVVLNLILNKKNIIIGFVIFACILMYVIETYINPQYLLKSIYKIFLFAGIPLLYCILDKNIKFKDYFTVKDKRQIIVSLAMGLGVYLFILLGYYVLRGFIDLDNIAMQLENNLNVNKNNFIFVAIYISFVNSMLEELFFRGFAFLMLKERSSRLYSYVISALAFSIYHVSILANWFNPIIYVVFIVGLFITGLFFNWLNEKNDNIYNSWIVHISANFSINTIGFIMFGLIEI